MRILTWNVNGIQNPFNYGQWRSKKSYKEVFETLDADIICVQELKAQKQGFPEQFALIEGYDAYFTFPLEKKGYSGVGVYVKKSLTVPCKAEEGITGILPVPDRHYCYKDAPEDEQIGYYPVNLDKATERLIDSEGRCILLDFQLFVLIGVYCPVNSGEKRLKFRRLFYNALRDRIIRLTQEAKRNVILLGDINILRDELDTADNKDIQKEQFDESIRESREWVRGMLQPHPEGLLIDTTRHRHPVRRGMFTCWNTRLNTRPTNFGTRIDYICISPALLPWMQDANIMPEIMGSDHCPVFLDFKETVDGCTLYDRLSHSETFPLLSVLRGERYRRSKNIHDMFKRVSTNNSATKKSSPKTEDSPSESEQHESNKRTRSSDTPQTTEKVTKKSKNQTLLSMFLKTPKEASARKDSSDKNALLRTSSEHTQEEVSTENFQDEEESYAVSQSTFSSSTYTENEQVKCSTLSSNVDNESLRLFRKAFSKPRVPLCTGHMEPCKKLDVKKPGVNYGRKFWCCSRPVGEVVENSSATNEKNPYQCRFFLWDSDLHKHPFSK
ncbi:AP-endonuclease Apn2 [Schizosaccharomyces japonicus yFS275]|uniref:DNA-(apurinic or apyrimidinic site) endonuclease n=1 Tax=Schizosaccharomyces japonicus (strain yFS275 / FY16936) TaxID=402676 RepID=B6K234_SCHJY|nr:AP-endonuclease Apn2 [Schizosaccharomyces japonicus yFS275]EEB07215.1 AP-endonuclease Apn2 [Schizosaccharomyces japonicus yFS275]